MARCPMKYTGLDWAERCKVRVVYAGDIYGQNVRLRLTADQSHEVHGPMAKPSPVAPAGAIRSPKCG